MFLNLLKQPVFLIFFLFIITSGCSTKKSKVPEAIQGSIDLSHWDFKTNGPIELNGEWSFYPNTFENKASTIAPSFLMVPGEWSQLKNKSLFTPDYGTYLLTIKLPKTHPILGLRVNGVSTSYSLLLNGNTIGSVGTPAISKEESQPSYARRIYSINSGDSIITLAFKVSNFNHYKGGLLQPIVLAAENDIVTAAKSNSLTGGILIGVCMINAIIYLILFFYIKEKYFLFYSLYILDIAIHLFCLVDRIFYNSFGTYSWIIAYKIELATIFLGAVGKFVFYNSFFNNLINKKVLIAVCSILMAEALIVIVAPAPLFTYADLFIPFTMLGTLICILVIFIKAIKQNKEGATLILLFNIFLLGILIHENLIIDKAVHGIEPLHFAIIFYITGLSALLIRRIVRVFNNEKKLAADVQIAKEKLEKQNRNLEEIVNRRTAQLIEAEKQSLHLQLEKKERDLDTLAATNLMKLQFTRNLVDELEELPKSEKELKPALSTLITRLKNQATIEEKLDVLQKDMGRVNAEFYERLSTRFPELSKTERELCAYIKLNLSTKDIADLRKTSLNTINVTRSRLRKKLGLNRDEELENFIQQF